MSPRFLADDALLAQCRVDHYRGSGPGGQKRNKTSNAVRLTHLPTKIVVTGTESRSTALNSLHAIRRLRVKLASDLREPVAERFEPPNWFLEIRRNGRIDVSHRHAFYAPAAGLVLDLLKEMKGSPAAVGALLGVSTTAVVRLLESDQHFWTAANHIRAEWSEPPLARRG